LRANVNLVLDLVGFLDGDGILDLFPRQPSCSSQPRQPPRVDPQRNLTFQRLEVCQHAIDKMV
jgi:hypothetical protein